MSFEDLKAQVNVQSMMNSNAILDSGKQKSKGHSTRQPTQVFMNLVQRKKKQAATSICVEFKKELDRSRHLIF